MENNQHPKQSEKVSYEKLAIAERVAKQRKRVENTYRYFGRGILRFLHMLSTWLDRILFNSKHGVLVSLALAIVLISVYGTDAQATSIDFSDTVTVDVVVEGNKDVYEFVGIPEKVEVTVSGSNSADVNNLASTSGYYVVADLRNLSEGVSTVSLEARNFPSSLKTVVNPNAISVTINKRESLKFQVSAEFINMNNLDVKYAVGDPIFDTNEVIVRASADTLNSISSVKALIDVSSKTEQFTQEAELVAYDQAGNKLSNVLIVPETVNVTVPIISTNKDVPVVVRVDGTIPNGKAIQTISLDSNMVRIYGSTTVLDGVVNVTKTISAEEITGNITNKIYLLDKPNGVRYMTPDKINVSITLGDEVSKQVDNAPIYTRNNTQGFKYTIKDEGDFETSVIVYGTSSNIEPINVDSFKGGTYQVYFDMSDLVVGENVVELKVLSTSPYLRFELVKKTITIIVTE